QVFLAGDGEVPRQVQARAVDSGLAERLEDRLHVRRATGLSALIRLRGIAARTRVVAEGGERGRGRDRVAVCVLEVSQGHDVAVALGEVDRGADDQVAHRVAR